MPQIVIAGQRLDAHFQWDDAVATWTYAASGVVTQNLPTDGLITSVTIGADPLQFDNAGTATPNDDAFMRVFNGIRIATDGGKTPFAYTDARGMFYDNRWTFGNAGAFGSMAVGNGNNNKAYGSLIHHCGIRPFRSGSGRRSSYDPTDLSGGYDASQLSTHTLQWTTPANTVLGTNATVDTTTVLKAKIGRWLGIPAGLAAMVPKPKFTEELFTIGGTSTDLGTRYNLPTGVWVNRTVIILTDNGTAPADVRDDTRITQLGVIIAKPQNSRPISKTWREWRQDTILAAGWTIDDGSASANVVTKDLPYAGVVVIDWPLLTGMKYGLNMVSGIGGQARQLGDIVLGFTVGTGNGTYKVYNMAYENVTPYYANQAYGDP